MAASGVSLVAVKTQNWGFVETKTLIGLWAEEDIQRQLASMGRKKNIWEGIAILYFRIPHNTLCLPPQILHKRLIKPLFSNALGNMQCPQEHLKTIVYAKFGG